MRPKYKSLRINTDKIMKALVLQFQIVPKISYYSALEHHFRGDLDLEKNHNLMKVFG